MSGAQVLQFPDQMESAWKVYAKTIAHYLGSMGADKALVDQVLATVKPIFLEHFRPARLELTRENAVEQLNTWVKRLANGLLIELVLREVELIQAGLRPDPVRR